MPFEVPPLPYDYAALEPHIDEQTMRLHHDKHHQAYVDKANAALEGTGEEDRPVEHILTILDELPEGKRMAIRNNAGGHANHSLFWEIMGPDGGGEPEGALADAIDATFGGLDELKKQINDAGVTGSAPAGPGSFTTARTSPSTRCRTRTRRSCNRTSRC
jgi:Fe-Mn family superoxide dismutase